MNVRQPYERTRADLNFDANFPALLKNAEGHVVEKGFARVSVENKSVDFTCDFVPLYKMGETMRVIRVLGEKEIHAFTGRVYLSSRKRLQLTEVADEVLEDVGLVHSINASIMGEVTPEPEPVCAPRFRRLIKKIPALISHPCDALVYSLSTSTIRFTCASQFRQGQKLRLKTGAPLPLCNVLLEVYQLIMFGDKITGHHCNILELSEQDRATLEEYTWSLNQRSRKLF